MAPMLFPLPVKLNSLFESVLEIQPLVILGSSLPHPHPLLVVPLCNVHLDNVFCDLFGLTPVNLTVQRESLLFSTEAVLIGFGEAFAIVQTHRKRLIFRHQSLFSRLISS